MFKFKEQSECTMLLFFLSGLLIILFIAIAASGGFDLPEGCCGEGTKTSGGWIYEYQTLIAGLAAAIIGLFAALYTKHQYEDTLLRRRLSEKAKMNDAISTICAYAKEVFFKTYDNEITENNTADMVEIASQHELELPTDEINILKDAIEYLDTETAKSVFELVIAYQVFNARNKHNPETDIQASNFRENTLYDCIWLYSLSLRLFDYARGNVESQPYEKPASEQMHRALNNIIFKRRDMYEIFHDPDISKITEKLNMSDTHHIYDDFNL